MVKKDQQIFTVIFLLELLYFIETRPQSKDGSMSRKFPETFNNNLTMEVQTQQYAEWNSPQPLNVSKTTWMENESSSQTLETRKKSKNRILFKGNQSHQDGSVKDSVDQDIIFPDTYQVIFENIPKINSQPECAKLGTTFCEDTDLYPRSLVENILKHKRVSIDLFGEDEISDEEKFAISNRNGGDTERFVCVGIQKTIFPTVGRNKNSKWKFIINQGATEGYVQGVRVEVCGREGSSCAVVGDIPDGYVTSCKQKYISRRLMSLTDHGDPIPDTFMLPSACCCSYRKDIGFLARFGAPQTPISIIDLL